MNLLFLAARAQERIGIENNLKINLFGNKGELRINQFVGEFINNALGYIGVAALVVFLWGGFTWLLSRGDPAEIKKAKDILKWGLIGLLVVFGSYIMLKALFGLMDLPNPRGINEIPANPAPAAPGGL